MASTSNREEELWLGSSSTSSSSGYNAKGDDALCWALWSLVMFDSV